MWYRKNVGGKEAVFRLLVGGLGTACALMLLGPAPLGLGLAASGAALALTGVFGYCPACAMVGRTPLKDRA